MAATSPRFFMAARMLPVLALVALMFPAGTAIAAGKVEEKAAVKEAESVRMADSAKAPAPVAGSDTVPVPAAKADSASDSASHAVPTAPATPAASADPAAAASPAATAPTAEETIVGAEEPEGITIEVDEDQSRNKGKSLPLALILSATLPGTGEFYLEDKGKAKTFLLMEAGFWAGLYVAWLSRESYLQSARNHAAEYAGIDAGAKSEKFLETMAVFRAYQEKQHRQDSYELAQVLSGKREQDYDIKPVEENYWDFGSSANPENTRNWRSFQSTLRYYRASKVAMSFALGALALNRLGSLMNTLQTYKRTSAKGLGWELTPDLGPDYAGTRLTLRF